MVQCWLVDCIFMPSEWNSKRMKFVNKIPLKNGPIFTNASHERFYTYRVFKREKDAIKLNRKLLRAYTNSWERTRKGMGPPWRVVGGCEIQEFPSVQELEQHLRSFLHKFFRVKIWGKKLKRGKQLTGGEIAMQDPLGLADLKKTPEEYEQIRKDMSERLKVLREANDDDDNDDDDDDDDDTDTEDVKSSQPPPPPPTTSTPKRKDLFDPDFTMKVGGKTLRLSDYLFETPAGWVQLLPKTK